MNLEDTDLVDNNDKVVRRALKHAYNLLLRNSIKQKPNINAEDLANLDPVNILNDTLLVKERVCNFLKSHCLDMASKLQSKSTHSTPDVIAGLILGYTAGSEEDLVFVRKNFNRNVREVFNNIIEIRSAKTQSDKALLLFNSEDAVKSIWMADTINLFNKLTSKFKKEKSLGVLNPDVSESESVILNRAAFLWGSDEGLDKCFRECVADYTSLMGKDKIRAFRSNLEIAFSKNKQELIKNQDKTSSYDLRLSQ